MKQELAELIIEAAKEDFDEDEIYIYEGYSGRGMFGRKTVGVVAPSIASILEIVIKNADKFVDEYGLPIFDNTGFSSDSMGFGVILY